MNAAPALTQWLTQELSRRITEVATSSMPAAEKLHFTVHLLQNDVPHYQWVGFYLVDPQAERQLFLGPYAGAATDHTRIAFGQGICGQAAEREATFVIGDVSQEINYLSCSIHVKSEIVVPVFHQGTLVGEIDIDSHELNPFTELDRQFLETLAAQLAPYVAELAQAGAPA